MNTEIEIPISELKSVLPGLSKIISKSTQLPVLQCVKVSLDPDEKLISVHAHNLDEIATIRLQNKANGLPGELLVPLEAMSKIVKGCSDDRSVRLMANETETRIRYALAGSSVDRLLPHISTHEWPEMKFIGGQPIPLDDAFKVAVREASECASGDSNRVALNGVCLDTRDKDGHYIVGSDGRCLYWANSFRFNLPQPLIIATGKFVTWPGFVNDGHWKLRMLPGVKVDPNDKKAEKIKEASPWLRIDSEHWSYVARAIDGQYPDWKQVLPIVDGKWTKVTLEDSAANDILRTILLLPGADTLNRTIVLEIAADGLALKAQGHERQDWTRVRVAGARITGKAVQVALNRDYLLQALRFGFKEININDSLAPVLFSSAAKTMLVMPVRLEGPPVSPCAGQNANAAQPISPPENTSAAPPSAPGVPTNTTEERKKMSTTTMTAPERGTLRANGNNGNNTQPENGEARSSFKAALEHIERVKTSLRDVIGALSEATALLKTAQKEQRLSAKEIDSVRAKLREIQSVKI